MLGRLGYGELLQFLYGFSRLITLHFECYAGKRVKTGVENSLGN
jgi:hypothetical protein